MQLQELGSEMQGIIQVKDYTIEQVSDQSTVVESGCKPDTSDFSIVEKAGNTDVHSEGEQCTALVVHEVQNADILYETHHSGLGILKDGCLDPEALAKSGMVLTDESSEEGSKSSCFEEEDSDPDDSSDSSSSEEDIWIIKEKISKSNEDTKEDSEPPRTKHELSVLPPVPKVDTVLGPHHKCVSIGLISSVLELTIVVEGNDDSRVLSDGSILWLTESRVPLGVVDEVFGPVKKPYYLVRFNVVSEIHDSAKLGVDVSCVAEFAEFVLKDNPSLYKKAIDASGLDDEELSDAEIEFSDDEKEHAAKTREKGKRGHDCSESAGGQAWEHSEAQDSKGRWQRRERGRGRGRSRGAGFHTAEAVDSAAMSVAGMDLHGTGWSATISGRNAPSPGRMNQRGRARPRPTTGRSKFQTSSRVSISGDRDVQDLGATYSRLHDGLSRGDWIHSPPRHSPVAGPSSNGSSHYQAPLLRRDERRDGPWYPEQAKVAVRQPHQAISMQGHPSFGVAPVPRHLQGSVAESRQQLSNGYSPYSFNSVSGPQIATDGQGNFFHITGPVSMPRDVGNAGRSNMHAMGMNLGTIMTSVLPQTSSNTFSVYNNQGQGTLNVRQGGHNPVYQPDSSHGSQQGSYVGSPPSYSQRMGAPDFRFQALPLVSQHGGPGGRGGLEGPGYEQGSAPHGHRNRYHGNQGSRGR